MGDIILFPKRTDQRERTLREALIEAVHGSQLPLAQKQIMEDWVDATLERHGYPWEWRASLECPQGTTPEQSEVMKEAVTSAMEQMQKTIGGCMVDALMLKVRLLKHEWGLDEPEGPE